VVLLVGDPSTLAIESDTVELLDSESQLAIGYFVLHLEGKVYGVREPDATLMGCSFEGVGERISRRGDHHAPFEKEPDATKIADAYLGANYDANRESDSFFGMSYQNAGKAMHDGNITWAPDGDEAFDDGSCVLQFDLEERVRIVAFNNTENRLDMPATLVDVWMDGDEFYSILSKWHQQFKIDWETAVGRELMSK
jgi:hypothetical protein